MRVSEASKAAADVIARSYWHAYGVPVAVTRFANIYGGGDLNFSRLILSAGGYKFSDFLRVGIPLTIIMWIGFSIILPVLYDLHATN